VIAVPAQTLLSSVCVSDLFMNELFQSLSHPIGQRRSVMSPAPDGRFRDAKEPRGRGIAFERHSEDVPELSLRDVGSEEAR
jgi:hypothetical protein